jgi:hypothetical protein
MREEDRRRDRRDTPIERRVVETLGENHIRPPLFQAEQRCLRSDERRAPPRHRRRNRSTIEWLVNLVKESDVMSVLKERRDEVAKICLDPAGEPSSPGRNCDSHRSVSWQ